MCCRQLYPHTIIPSAGATQICVSTVLQMKLNDFQVDNLAEQKLASADTTHINIMCVALQLKMTRSQFTNWLCGQKTTSCKTKPPKLPADRKPGPPFTVLDEQQAQLQKMMAGMKVSAVILGSGGLWERGVEGCESEGGVWGMWDGKGGCGECGRERGGVGNAGSCGRVGVWRGGQ